MLKNLFEGNLAWDAIPLFVHDYRRHAHFKSGIAVRGVEFLDRVAGGASEPVGIELGAVDL